MKPITEEKFNKVVGFLSENNIDFLLLSDYEGANDINMQYLTGHPMDAMCIITKNGETFLIPWDLALARKYAEVDEIIDLANHGNSTFNYLSYFLKEKIQKEKVKVGINTSASFGNYIMFKKAVPQMEIFQEPMLISQLLGELRTTKSAAELNLLRKAANIGNKTIPEIEKFAKNATNEMEIDLDLHVRKTMISLGAEDVAFPTLVGNSSRAHNIHCHPAASNAKFASPGLALIDFGAKYEGYHSDITVPITFGKLNDEQIKIRDLTRKAYDAAIETLDVGVPLWKVHEAAIAVIKKAGYNMPHSLGHGLGLSVHDAPLLGAKPTNAVALQYWKETKAENGMVFTIEPGVYKEGLGGQRLENDTIIWNDKVEIITKSRFIEA